MISSSELDELLRIAKEKLESKKGMLPKKDVETWDKRARESFYRTMTEVLRERYGMDESKAKNYIYVERFNPFPGEKGGKLFNSYLYPDAIMKSDDGQKIAVELDNGASGSRIKNALAKASILKLVGDFNKIVVFFFTYPTGALDKFRLAEKEQRVLKFYQENLSTWLILI